MKTEGQPLVIQQRKKHYKINSYNSVLFTLHILFKKKKKNGKKEIGIFNITRYELLDSVPEKHLFYIKVTAL